jgi:aspartyl-tRNA(Asn)/glutamyl-tRNA(Gln) amidotransferase subunit B
MQHEDKYQLIVGLEVHAQLNTKSKIFSTDNNSFGGDPNVNISVISLGHPGTMPRLNKSVIEKAILMGLACGCQITKFGFFDRKNYFYPDLPKGYQITQDKKPICIGGSIPIPHCSGQKAVALNRIHMEEDAGKSIHVGGGNESQIDLNRAGVPLIEIVTEPEIYSAEAAGETLAEVRRLVRYLDVSDGNMEEGSMRCDANISVRLKSDKELGKKVEVKNMNSIRNVMRAIKHEFSRQIQAIEAGEEIISETRTFDADKGKTYGMRSKEELNDYRYFPEPDLSPMQVSDEWLSEIKAKMPELPNQLFERLVKQFGLKKETALILVEDQKAALFFLEVAGVSTNYKIAANLIVGALRSVLNELKVSLSTIPIQPNQLADLVDMIAQNKISSSSAVQNLLPRLINAPDLDVVAMAENEGLIHDDNEDEIVKIVEAVLADHPQKVTAYLKGKKGLIGMFMGEVMSRTKGKVDPKVANKLVMESLSKINK